MEKVLIFEMESEFKEVFYLDGKLCKWFLYVRMIGGEYEIKRV